LPDDLKKQAKKSAFLKKIPLLVSAGSATITVG
jgi:hypothetical protein